jgi:methyl-accepting chemotaxis protein
MEERPENRRRNYYIKKDFQRNFILKFCALVAIGSLISGVIVYAMSLSTVTTSFERSRLVIKSTADFILPAVLLASAVVIFVIGLATIFITLFTSHKIAGPLYRLEKNVQEINDGDFRVRFNLRSNDEIKPLAERLDMMVLTLRNRLLDIRSNLQEMEASLGLAESVMPMEARDKLQRLKEIMCRFKL